MNKTMLNDEIENELEEIGKMEVGSANYKTAVEGVTKLMDRAIELERFETETKKNEEHYEDDFELKKVQLIEDRKDRKARNYITIAGIAIPAVISIWGTLKTLKFEEVGTVTTLAGKEHIRKIFNLFR